MELLALAAFLYLAPVARVLDHAGPTARGWLLALAAVPALLAADAIHKRLRAHGARSVRNRTATGSGGGTAGGSTGGRPEVLAP